ncbi:MAG: hypothetical protein PW843_18785 [Azospirillaceae bacterium]|nr:hypothetical protein [Azospirillaceae bacterium]
MDTYSLRVRENILPLSVADTLPKAFEEWYFTESVHDHEEPVETCGLCDKEQIRYHFEIANLFTKNTLWAGSHCILQFDVSVFEEDRRLSPEEAKRKLDKLTTQMRQEACIRALRKLAEAEDSDILTNALHYYELNKKLTPNFAFVVFWRLQKNRIDHNPSFFKINLSKGKYVADLRKMETSRVHFFWHALSASQKKKAIALGHRAP